MTGADRGGPSAPGGRPPLAERLDLSPHPEGGWYRRTWAAAEHVRTPDGRVRPAATLILFLLPAGECSAWHRVASDEVWIWGGGRVELRLGGTGGRPGDGPRTRLGDGPGAVRHAVVPAGTWQRTEPVDVDGVASCLVSPGFDFADFELADRSGPAS